MNGREVEGAGSHKRRTCDSEVHAGLSVGGRAALTACGAHMLQGTPPTVMARLEGRPVSRWRPVMVSAVPPALGPLSGDTPITKGSWVGQS